jgi:hypothetical protein
MQILLAGMRLDRGGLARLLASLCESEIREGPLRNLVDEAVSDLAGGRAPGFRWFLSLLDRAAMLPGAGFGQSLIFFRKSILTLDGVIADITSDDRLGYVVTRTGFLQITREMHLRGWASPVSRDFGSHLSNLDLMTLYWALPEASMRQWSRWLDPKQWGMR